MAAPSVVGIASGGKDGAGTFTVTPPAGAGSYLAFLAGYAGGATPTPPSGWTLLTTGGFDSWTWCAVYRGTASAGATWTNHADGYGLVVVGYSGDITIVSSAMTPSGSNSESSHQYAPGLTTGAAESLVVSAVIGDTFGVPYDPAPAYPDGSTDRYTYYFDAAGGWFDRYGATLAHRVTPASTTLDAVPFVLQTTSGYANTGYYNTGWTAELTVGGGSAPAHSGSVSLSGSGTGTFARVAPLQKWRDTAVAQIATRQAKILYLGDSLFEGSGSSTKAGRFIDQLNAKIRTRYSRPAGGEGWISPFYTTFSDSPWMGSRGTTTGTQSAYGQGRKALALATGQYWETTVTGTSVDVAVHQFTSGGDLAVTVDGSSAGTLDTNSVQQYAKTHRVTLGAAGSHTVRVTATSGLVYVEGMVVYNGDESSGLTHWESARYGYASADFTQDSPGDHVSGGWASAGYFDLVVWDLFNNDFIGALSTPAQVATRFLSYMSAVPGYPSALVVGWWRGAILSGTNGLGYTYDQYLAALRDAAATLPGGSALLDLSTYVPYGGPPGGVSSDGVHPTSLGYGVATDVVDSYLATGTYSTGFTGAVSLSGSGTLTRAGTPRPAASRALSGMGTLALGGSPSVVQSIPLSGAGALVPTGRPAVSQSAALSGSGSLTWTASASVARSLGLSGSGSLSSTAVPKPQAALSLSGSGALTMTSLQGIGGALSLSGNGNLGRTGSPGHQGTLSASGAGTATDAGAPGLRGSLGTAGSGTLVPMGAFLRSIALSGTGSLSTAAVVSFTRSASYSGSGTLGVTARVFLTGSVALSGSGTLVAAGLGAVGDSYLPHLFGGVSLVAYRKDGSVLLPYLYKA